MNYLILYRSDYSIADGPLGAEPLGEKQQKFKAKDDDEAIAKTLRLNLPGAELYKQVSFP